MVTGGDYVETLFLFHGHRSFASRHLAKPSIGLAPVIFVIWFHLLIITDLDDLLTTNDSGA